MQEIILVIHLIFTVSLVVLVLIQRSSGGALGMGGGQGGAMSGRGSATLITRVTTYLAAGFFATSLGLAVMAKQHSADSSVFDTPQPVIEKTAPKEAVDGKADPVIIPDPK